MRARAKVVTATGPVLAGPGVLVSARLTGNVAGQQDVICTLRDHESNTTDPTLVLVVLRVNATTFHDTWPGSDVELEYTRGITAEFSASGAALCLAWNAS